LKYLLDTNVLSEGTKQEPNAAAIAWLHAHQAMSVVDAVVLAEVRMGILLRPLGKKRSALLHWFTQGVAFLDCLPWDSETAMVWADLVASLRKRGKAMPLFDSMVAATALRRDLTLVTRNVKDFRVAKTKLLNPFE
jgi:toxin FitB